jgi:hypothetical protein
MSHAFVGFDIRQFTPNHLTRQTSGILPYPIDLKHFKTHRNHLKNLNQTTDIKVLDHFDIIDSVEVITLLAKKMKKYFSILTTISIILTASHADIWTSTDGKQLEGGFLGYDYASGNISIERSYDKKRFQIPEGTVIPSDRIKAVTLENKNTSPYWINDYRMAKAQNGDKCCILLITNGSDPEKFELFYHKLLLRDVFIKLVKSRNLVICIQDTIPEEFDQLPQAKQKLSEWQRGTPLMITADFRNEKIQNARIFMGWKRLHLNRPGDPFKQTQNQKFVPLEEIDKEIRKFDRD